MREYFSPPVVAERKSLFIRVEAWRRSHHWGIVIYTIMPVGLRILVFCPLSGKLKDIPLSLLCGGEKKPVFILVPCGSAVKIGDSFGGLYIDWIYLWSFYLSSPPASQARRLPAGGKAKLFIIVKILSEKYFFMCNF